MTKAFILCAGKGTRLQPYTDHRAKPAIEFLTVPMLGYSTYPMEKLGITDFILNTHHLPGSVEQAVAQLLPEKKYNIIHEEQLLGSAGALGNARHLLEDAQHFFVLNGDSVNLYAQLEILNQLVSMHQAEDAYASMLAIPHKEAGKSLSAVWVDKNSHVCGFGKSAPQPKSQPFHFTGILYFSRRALDDMPNTFSNTLLDVITPAFRRGEKVLCKVTQDLLFGETGNIDDYIKFQNECFFHLRDNDVWGRYLLELVQYYQPGFKLLDRKQAALENYTLSEDALLAMNTTSTLKMAPTAKITGHVALGPNCCLEANSSLENVSVMSGAQAVLRQSLANSIIF